jgi:hypothetical protein
MLNTGFLEDLPWQKVKLWRGGTGVSAWSGLVDLKEKRRRPAFFALEQLSEHLRRYDDVQRIAADDESLRLYRVIRNKRVLWIAWIEPESLVLPGDTRPRSEIELPMAASHVVVERMVMGPGDVNKTRRIFPVIGETIPLVITPMPVYVYASY